MPAEDSSVTRVGAPTLIYFAIAFAIPWAVVLVVMAVFGTPGTGDAINTIYPVIFVAMIAGPLVAGLVMTGITEGRDGVRALFGRVAHWRVAPRYYLAVLLVPVTIFVVLLIASSFGDQYVPAAIARGEYMTIAVGLAVGLVAGFCEEVGWTGYATPKSLPVSGVLGTALPLGLIHGLWHLPADFWGEGARFGWLFVPYFIAFWMVGLLALRILIVWLYARTQSVLIAQLTHASYTGGLLALWPSTQSPLEDLWWTGPFAVLLLAVVIGLDWMSRHMPRRRATH